MKVIKLNAIDSTNEYLKSLATQQILDNFTVVTTENQKNGKGQRGATWVSEVGKNLIMSVLVKDFIFDNEQIFDLNIIVSLSVLEVLEELRIPNLAIKWPNDIMSYNKKIGGILIENTIKSDTSIVSIVGLGLNVNQTNFENFPFGSSLAVICKSTFDKEKLLRLIVEKIEQKINLWSKESNFFWNLYLEKLFKKGIPMPFKNKQNQNFMGIIQGISPVGKLQVLLEDDSVAEFDIKEIKMLY